MSGNKPHFLFFFLISIIFIGSVNFTNPVLSQDHGMKNPIMMVPGEFNWTEGPPSLPPGARIAILEGDPSKEGPFIMRAKLPANYQIPPHWHPAIEHVTVISGSFFMGHGEKLDKENAKELTPGSIAVMDIGVRHFAFTKGESEIQLHGVGPWGITYVNEDDDPRKKTMTRQ